MAQNTQFIIDFDSTLISVEALDVLAGIVLESNPDRDALVKQIESITQLGMNGSITFAESLSRRLSLFLPELHHIDELTSFLTEHITPSVTRNADWFRAHSHSIYVISGGFCEYITPVVATLGITVEHVLANRFLTDEHGVITGYDPESPLSQAQGKVVQVEKLGLNGEVVVIGDGYTDYEIRKFGKASQFIAFVENVLRESVVSHADMVAHSFDEISAKYA